MKKIASVIVGLLMLSSASAATPASPKSSSSPLAKRIELRKQQRLQRRASSSSASVTILRPSRRSSSSYSYTGTPVRGVLQIDQIATGTSQQIVGQVPYTLLSFDASAANEDIVLSSLKFHAEQGNLASGTQYTLSTVNANGDLTPFAYATSSANVLTFTNIQTVIHRDDTRRFALRAKLIASDTSLAVGFHTTDPLFVQAQGLQYGRDLAPGIQVDNIPCESQYVCRVIVHTHPGVLLYK